MDIPFGLVPLIAAKRNGNLECLHMGAVAHVNAQGHVLSAAGSAHWQSFTRSTLKPFQALPFVRGGGLQAFGFDAPLTALLCASHNGEAVHVAGVDRILGAARLPYKALRCGCEVPALHTTVGQAIPPNSVFDERHHNCSGKHSGMLAYCVQHGLPTANYIDFDHPLQGAIRTAIERVASVDLSGLPHGVDGCSAPNQVLPLSALATGFARMAAAVGGQATGLDDADATALASLGEAMRTEAYMVSGQGRNDWAFNKAGRGDWINKIGADGVQVLASVSRGEAFALKVIDATKTASHAATVAVLDQLGWIDDAQRELLLPWRFTPIVNAAGREVGSREAVFQMRPL